MNIVPFHIGWVRRLFPCRRPQYWRRRDVPTSCAKCGATPPPAPSMEKGAASLFNFAFTGWQVKRLWVFWPVYGWSAHCADCMMRDELAKPPEQTLLGKLARAPKIWQGGTIQVPFQGGPPS